MSPRPRLVASIVASLALLALFALTPVLAAPPAPSTTLAAATKLSALGPKDGRVSSLLVAGDRAVYIASYDIENRFELYSTPVAGGTPLRLSEGLPAGQVEDVELAGSRAVFSYRFDSGGQRAIYSVLAAGGTPLRLTPEYANNTLGGGEFAFFVSGDRAVYSVDQERAGVPGLYSVPVAGGAVVKLNPDLPDPGVGLAWRVRSVRDSDDKSLVVFTMALPGNSDGQLYASPVAGGGASLLSGAAALSSVQLSAFMVTPNGARVVYRSPSGGSTRLVSVNSTGGDLQELSTATGGPTLLITPDSARAVFLVPGAGGADLVSVPVGGGAPTPLASGVSEPFVLSPAGEVFFSPVAGGLQRVAASGGPVSTVLASGNVNVSSLRFVGTRLFFSAGPFGDVGLYVSQDGAAATRIDDPSVSGGGIFAIEPSLDGAVVYYTANVPNGPVRLYRVAASGGASLPLNPGTSANLRLTLIQGIDASGAVLFTEGNSSGQGLPPSGATIFRVGAAAALPATTVDSSRAIVGDVSNFVVSPTDQRAVYLADQETDGVAELYSVPVAGGTPVKLNTAGQVVLSFAVSPVGGRVVYLAGTLGATGTQLYSVPIAGGTRALVGDPVVDEIIQQFSFTPDGSTLFYLTGTSNVPSTSTLRRAPAAGGSATPVAQNVVNYKLAFAAGRVLYITEGFPNQLNSAPIVGGDAASLGSFGTGGEAVLITTGTRVIYTPSGPFGGTLGLVSQPVEGGTATPLFDGDPNFVPANVRLSADGAFVLAGALLSRTNLNDPLLLQLKRVPVEGGTAAILVERSFPAEYDPTQVNFAFEQAPGGGPVVFRIAEDVPDPNIVRHTLGSIAIVGGEPAILYGPAELTTVVLPFALSDDGAQVLFQTTGELFRGATVGGTPAKLNGVGGVAEFAFGADGAALFIESGSLYRATPGAAPVQVAGIPAGLVPSLGEQVGNLMVFTGARDIVSTLNSRLVELYAVDLSEVAQSNKLYLPLLRK